MENEGEKKPVKNNIQAVNDGISRAYADDKPMNAIKQSTEGNSSSSWPTPPKKSDSKVKVANGKDLMEVAWNEMWAFYDKILDFIVDTALDFVVYALYPEKPASNGKKEEKADAFAAGEQKLKKKIQEIKKQKDLAIAVHKEISGNLQKTLDGERTTWKLLPKEPDFFSELVAVKRSALNDPQSPEAKMIAEFEKIPEKIEKMAENDEKLTTIAYYQAIMEEYLKPTTKKEEIKKAKKQYKNDKEELKKKLEDIKKIYENPQKEQEKMGERISENSDRYYNALVANISKIRTSNENNPQKLQEELGKYMDSIKGSLTKAQELVYEEMYKKDKNVKKKASAALAETSNTINIGRDNDVRDKLKKMTLIWVAMEEYLNPKAKKREIEAARKRYAIDDVFNAKKKEINNEYENPEIRKRKTLQYIQSEAVKYYQDIEKKLNQATDPAKNKEVQEECLAELSEKLKETRKKIYLKKQKDKDAYLETEIKRFEDDGNKKTAASENISVQNWSTNKVLELIKNVYTSSR